MTARAFALTGAVLAALATGCAAAGPESAPPQVAAGPRENTASALADPADSRLGEPLIDPARLLRRRLPAGVPAIDRPRFQRAGQVDWLRDVEPVLVAWHRPGQTSALDAATVAGGRDIGTVAVFDAVVDGRTLHFAPSGDGFVDAETGTWWTVLGHAVHGQLAGRRLVSQPAVDTFWFAWTGVRPGSQVAF